MSPELAMAIDAHIQLVRAERRVERLKLALEAALRRVPNSELPEYVRQTEATPQGTPQGTDR